MKPVNHIEISDGDTNIVSVAVCPLKNVNNADLVVNNTHCCINGTLKCDHFWKFIHSEKGTLIQCAQLSDTPIPEFTRVQL